MKTARLSGADDRDAGPAVNPVLPDDPEIADAIRQLLSKPLEPLTVTLPPQMALAVRRWALEFHAHPDDVAAAGICESIHGSLEKIDEDRKREAEGGDAHCPEEAGCVNRLVFGFKRERLEQAAGSAEAPPRARQLLPLSRAADSFLESLADTTGATLEEILTGMIEDTVSDALGDSLVLLAWVQRFLDREGAAAA